MAKTRRTPEETRDAVLKVKALIAEGSTIQDALKTVGLAGSAYRRNMNKTFVGKPGKHGKMDISQLPPRPKKGKGGKRLPKMIDMTDIGSVAGRIAKLDKRLRDINDMVQERIDLVGVLVKLLKVKA